MGRSDLSKTNFDSVYQNYYANVSPSGVFDQEEVGAGHTVCAFIPDLVHWYFLQRGKGSRPRPPTGGPGNWLALIATGVMVPRLTVAMGARLCRRKHKPRWATGQVQRWPV